MWSSSQLQLALEPTNQIEAGGSSCEKFRLQMDEQSELAWRLYPQSGENQCLRLVTHSNYSSKQGSHIQIAAESSAVFMLPRMKCATWSGPDLCQGSLGQFEQIQVCSPGEKKNKNKIAIFLYI